VDFAQMWSKGSDPFVGIRGLKRRKNNEK